MPLNSTDWYEGWRLLWSHNLDDGSAEAALYLEHPLNGSLSVFLLAVRNTGGVREEFGRLTDHRLLAGLRLAFP